MRRLNKSDWKMVNEALALLEAEMADEEPDAYDDSDEANVRRETYEGRIAQIEDVRSKVLQRII